MRDGSRLSGRMRCDPERESNETSIGTDEFLLTVIYDKFSKRMPWTPTVILSAPWKTTRARAVRRWRSGTVTVDTEFGTAEIDLGQDGEMPPRYAIVQTGLSVEHMHLIGGNVLAAIPTTLRDRCAMEAKRNTAWLGPYRFAVTDRDHAGPGGRMIGPYNGGSHSWKLAFPEGRAWLLAFMIDGFSRGIMLRADDGAEWGAEWTPGLDGALYWWDASAMQYAREWQDRRPDKRGWGWYPSTDGFCAYGAALAQEVITDTSHAPRRDSAAFALAALGCKAARYMAREFVVEAMRCWSMDRRVPATSPATPDDNGYTPLWQAIQDPAQPTLDRRHAHLIRAFAEGANLELLTAQERAQYLPALVQIVARADDGRGVLDRSFTGDAAHSGLPAPACMFFQQALLCDALSRLAEAAPGTAGAVLLTAQRIARWWGANPPYFAHTGGNYRTALDAPHAGKIGHDYSLFTVRDTWAGYGSFDGVVSASVQRVVTQGAGMGELPLDYVVPARRPW